MLDSQIELTDSGSDPDRSSPPHTDEGPSAYDASRIVRPSGISKKTISGLTFSELILNPDFMELHEQKLRLQERVGFLVERVLALEEMCDRLEAAGALCGSLVLFFCLTSLWQPPRKGGPGRTQLRLPHAKPHRIARQRPPAAGPDQSRRLPRSRSASKYRANR
jgi:hypothetical protein